MGKISKQLWKQTKTGRGAQTTEEHKQNKKSVI